MVLTKLEVESYYSAATMTLAEELNGAIEGIQQRRAAMKSQRSALHSLNANTFTKDNIDEAQSFRVREMELDRNELALRQRIGSEWFKAIRTDNVGEWRRAEAELSELKATVISDLLRCGFENERNGRPIIAQIVPMHSGVRAVTAHQDTMQARVQSTEGKAANAIAIEQIERSLNQAIRRLANA